MHGVGEASKVEPGESGELREISSSFEGLGEKMEEVEVGMSLKVDPMSRKFGICFRAETEVGPVFVTSLTPDSPVDQWNQECQVEYAICPCDLIVSVSGSDTAQGIVEQPMNSATAEICFLRSGPRWHPFGVTAEAMDRGAMAMPKGMRFSVNSGQPGLGEAEETTDLMPLQVASIIISVVLSAPQIVEQQQ